MTIHQGELLKTINTPDDLRKLSVDQLDTLCQELRDFIIANASVNGGHFGSSLGVTELTVALHYAFNTPNDRIVWDVGHQAYIHKLLTGRKDKFHTNRKKGGLSGFTKRSESEYDAFVAGHASVSISAALGMAMASKLKGEDRKHIAVIGDGAMTGGIAFEGMNHAGAEVADCLVILNDNQISIDPNVGALKNYLVELAASKSFNSLRYGLKKALSKSGKVGENLDHLAASIEKSLKTFIFEQSNFFEALNFRYFGPVDGHDTKKLIHLLEEIKTYPGPKVLHILTTKGKGFLPAEAEQVKWHATGGFDPELYCPDTGKLSPAQNKPNDAPSPLKYQQIFGHTMVELAEQDERIVGITPAMPSGSSLDIMMKAMPDRAFDVGIAEQHAVTFSAGLACEGLIPFCNIYSTFAQRAYDQIIHDVCIEKTPVIFCFDRAGVVGEDGETHHGAFDLAYLRPIPNTIICAPMNEYELRNMMYTASKYEKGPLFIRYPRGKGVLVDWKNKMKKIKIGTSRKISVGKDIAILSLGHPGNAVQEALAQYKGKHKPAHYDMRFAKPLDEKGLHQICKDYKQIITIEDGVIKGGFGSAVLEFMADNGYTNKVTRLGLPDRFIKHASAAEQHAEAGIDVEGILKVLNS